MNENFVHTSSPKTTSSNTLMQTSTPKQGSTTGFGFTSSLSSGIAQPGGFLNSTLQTGTTKQPVSTMYAAQTASANTNSARITPTGNATLFNMSTSAVSASATPTSAVTSSPFLGSNPLNVPQLFKPPTTSQNAQLKLPLPNSLATSSNSLTLGGNNPTTTVQGVLNFGSTPKSTSAGSTAFSSLKTSLSPASSNAITTASATTITLPSSTTSLTSSLSNKPVTSTSASASPLQSLTFQQLEEVILNKWTAELYEQEKVFLNQATQINIWDKVINENAEKLTLLHSTMEKVRKQQTKINDDLEIIFTHQKDLEACLVPMEKEDLLSVLKADPNRKNLYINAKKIDSQIKTMSEDLKETIEHINETSRSHDIEDPVIQVGRILNAHMESLRWIDEHTARMQDYFDSLLKMHDDLRRECEISKHDVY